MTQDSDEPGGRRSGIDLDAQTQALTPGQEKARTTDGHLRDEEPLTTASIGDYRIIRKIGEGGMGVVYEAEQQRPRRRVALKVIRGGLASDDRHVKMFEREIEALARLKHPGIASIYESGRSDDGQMFFAMEFVEGIDLGDFVERRRTMTGELPSVDDQLRLFSRIAAVVSYAHLRGIIHRDLKPQNILVTDDGEALATMSGERVGVKILDFGLARINDPEFRGNTAASEVGQIKGTLLYMSPEQLKGRPDDIDVRSDVYALGVMLYEMLTGRIPYDLTQASLPEAMRIICEDPPIPLRRALTETGMRTGRIDRDVETIVLKALEKEPERRYQSVAAMLEDVERYLTSQPILARPPSPYYQFRKLVARHRAAFASLAVIFVLLLGFGIAMAAQSIRIANERDRALIAEERAREAENTAEVRRKEAERSRDEAITARNNESKQRDIAEENFKRATDEQERAEDALKRAEEQKTIAQRSQLAEAEQRRIAVQNLSTARDEQHRAEQQTKIAVEQRTLADQRKTEADKRAEENRRLLYVSEMNLAQKSLEGADVASVHQLLKNHIPKPGETDLRGFEWYHLWRLSNEGRWTQRQLGSILRTTFSRDGRFVATSTAETKDGETRWQVSILDANSGKVLQTAKNYREPVLFSQDASELLAVSAEGRVTRLNVYSPQTTPTNIIVSPNSLVWPASNGTLVAVFGPDKMLQIWDPFAERKIVDINTSITDYKSLAGIHFSSDQTLVIAGDRTDGRGVVTFWNANTGVRTGELPLTSIDDCWGMNISPDGTLLATFGKNGVVRLWNFFTRTEILRTTVFDKATRYGLSSYHLTFSPHGNQLATTVGRIIRVLDVTSLKEIRSPILEHDQIGSFAFSPDGASIATGARNRGLTLWNVKQSAEDPASRRKSTSPVLSPDGRLLATAHPDRGIHLVDFSTGRGVAVLRPADLNGTEYLTSTKFSRDGSLVGALRSPDNALELWSLPTFEKRPVVVNEKVSGFDFSPTGGLVATTYGQGPVRVWDINAGRQVFSVPEGSTARFSPNGEMLVVSTAKTLKVIDIRNGSGEIKVYQLQDSTSSWALSSDGKTAGIATSDGIVLWNYVSGEETLIPSSQVGAVASSIVFSQNAKRLVASGSYGYVIIWDLETLKEVQRFSGIAFSTQFSSDDKILIFRSYDDDAVQILRGATDEEVARQRGR